MKKFGIICLLLLLAAIVPEPRAGSLDFAWSLGLLMSLAFISHQVARELAIPEIAGWMAAGLVVGDSGLRAVLPSASDAIEVVYTVSALWVGCLLGLSLNWQRARLDSALPLITLISTVASAAAFCAGLVLLADFTPGVAVPLAAAATVWGPIVASTLTQKHELMLIASFGAVASLLTVTAAVVYGIQQDALAATASSFLIRLWASVAVGALIAASLVWLRLLERRMTAIASLSGSLFLLALFSLETQLLPLISGIGVGIVLGLQDVPKRQLMDMLEPVRIPATLVLFALIGATIDPKQLLSTASPWLLEILLLQFLVLLTMRVLAPPIWYPLAMNESDFSRRKSLLLLLPHGALTFELTLRPGGMVELFTPPFSQLLDQIATADLVLYVMVMSTLAMLIERLLHQPSDSPFKPVDSAPESAPASAQTQK